METVLQESTVEEQHSAARFLCAKGLNVNYIHKKYFLFRVGSVCRVKQFTAGGGKHFVDDEEFATEARRWLRQQTKVFYAADFDALVKRWDKCTSVGGGYVEK
jgi:hypothetical protein